MTWAWFEESGLILQDGGIILCDECPCDITGTGTGTGTITLVDCLWCPDGKAPDAWLLEISGMVDPWPGTGSGYPEDCDCDHFNSSFIIDSGDAGCNKYSYAGEIWCNPGGINADNWTHYFQITILEGTDPNTWKLRVYIRIRAQGTMISCNDVGEVRIYYSLDNLTQNCWDVDDLLIPYESHACYRSLGYGCDDGGEMISCDDWANPCSNYDGLTVRVSAA